MIVLLGERYGYMPGPDMIGQEARKRRGFRLDDLDISITQLEIEYGALSTKESLRNTFFYFREMDTEDLPRAFREETARRQADESLQPWEKISAAVGIARYEKGTYRETEEVLRKADEAMYADKLAMKAARTD